MKALLVALLLVFIGLQYRLWIGDGSFAQVERLTDQLDIQSAENQGLEQRNEALYAEIDGLREGLESVEEHARSELGMIKEGETFYMIIEE